MIGPKTKWQLVAEALAAGRSVDEVRAEFEPELHQRIMEQKVRKEARARRSTGPVVWGFVYIFAAGELVKVGMSDAGVEARWNNIKCSNPLLEPPLYVTGPLGSRVREAERRAHEALAEHRKHGEWFSCDRTVAIAVVKRIEQEMGNGPA